MEPVHGTSSVSIQIGRFPVERRASQPLPFIPRMKENAIWAWNMSVEKLQRASTDLNKLLQKVVAAIRAFFEPQFESAKKTVQDLYSRLTDQPAPVTAPPDAAPAFQKQEEVPPEREAVEEPQFFVPPAVEGPAKEPRPLEVQMPMKINAFAQPPEASEAESSSTNALVAVTAPVDVERVGIFSLIKNWFRWR